MRLRKDFIWLPVQRITVHQGQEGKVEWLHPWWWELKASALTLWLPLSLKTTNLQYFSCISTQMLQAVIDVLDMNTQG